MNIPLAARGPAAVALLAVGTSFALAQVPAAGTATGTFTLKGKATPLTSAAAFVDQDDKSGATVLVLADRPIPAAKWTKGSDLSGWRRETKGLVGVAFWIDAKGEVNRSDFYDGTDFPTSTSGIFEVRLDGPPGKVVAGGVKATAGAAKLREPVGIDVKFNAALK